MGETPTLTYEYFDLLMHDVPLTLAEGDAVAVAVSGGADSMALTLLLGNWCAVRNIDLVALSVDHGLRPEAAGECEKVRDWLSARGIAHETLTAEGEIPPGSLQDQARRLRYRLLGRRCAELGIKYLFLAHHRDDQAETFLLRLARGSGVDGLAAMRKLAPFPVRPEGNAPAELPQVCRPLLDCGKKQIEDYLTSCRQDWIEDPSNRDMKHNRVQVRDFLARTTITGLTAERLADTAKRMRAVQEMMERMTAELAEKAARLDPLGYAEINVPLLLAGEREISCRLLARLLKCIAGADFPPRFEKTRNLYDRLAAVEKVDQTIGGCRAVLISADNLLLAREEAAIAGGQEVKAGQRLLWDGRFLLEAGESGKLTCLGQGGWRDLLRDRPELKENKALKYVVLTLPCLEKAEGNRLLPSVLPGEEDSALKAQFQPSGDNFAEMI